MASALLRHDREQFLLQVDVRTIDYIDTYDTEDIRYREYIHIGSNLYITHESVTPCPSGTAPIRVDGVYFLGGGSIDERFRFGHRSSVAPAVRSDCLI